MLRDRSWTSSRAKTLPGHFRGGGPSWRGFLISPAHLIENCDRKHPWEEVLVTREDLGFATGVVEVKRTSGAWLLRKGICATRPAPGPPAPVISLTVRRAGGRW